MQLLPLEHVNGHLFVIIGEDNWLVDTGAPSSFGNVELVIQNRIFPCSISYMGLNAASLSSFVGHETAGSIGMDVLKHFDLLFDMPKGHIHFSKEYIYMEGDTVTTEELMDIPIVSASIEGNTYRMLFDTGAQISYFQDKSLVTYPEAGILRDFYPGFGQFETETYSVETTLGNYANILRYGSLPDLLGMT